MTSNSTPRTMKTCVHTKTGMGMFLLCITGIHNGQTVQTIHCPSVGERIHTVCPSICGHIPQPRTAARCPDTPPRGRTLSPQCSGREPDTEGPTVCEFMCVTRPGQAPRTGRGLVGVGGGEGMGLLSRVLECSGTIWW